MGEWVCTLWVCCHFETCGRTLWQPYLAPYIALWLISKEREDCISVSLFLAEKVLQEVFFVFVLNHGIFDGVFFWFLYLNNPKTQLVWYCWAWRSAASTWKNFSLSSQHPCCQNSLGGAAGEKMWVRVCLAFGGGNELPGTFGDRRWIWVGHAYFAQLHFIGGSSQMRAGTFCRYLW